MNQLLLILDLSLGFIRQMVVGTDTVHAALVPGAAAHEYKDYGGL